MNESRMVKKGFTIVEVSLIIIVTVISASIAFPYFFSSKGQLLKEHCRNNQRTILWKTRECAIKYPGLGDGLRGMERGEVCEFLLGKRMVKSRDIFRCPSNDSATEKPNDYKIVFNSVGKLIGVECTVDDSHNSP